MFVRGDAARLPFRSSQFDIVIGSPPYCDARLYLEDGEDPGIARGTREWVDWMLRVTEECLRVSKGLVIWVCAGPTKDRCYQPAPEGLLWEWYVRGGHCYRPVIWHRYGIPGSGSDEWFRCDTEYCLAFKRPGKMSWADNTANGQPPRWAPGGAMSYRLSDGSRVNQRGGSASSCMTARLANGERQRPGNPSQVLACRKDLEPVEGATLFPDLDHPDEGGSRNQWGGVATSGTSRKANGERQRPGRPSHVSARDHTKRRTDGTMEAQSYVPPVLSNPGNFFHTDSGGNQLGHPFAHANEAPFPVDVPRWFLASHCPPGGLVLDPFSGSASTGQAALETGRRYVGLDLRMSQCRLGRRRLRTVTPGFVFREEGGPCVT